jgi:hypothetical protein
MSERTIAQLIVVGFVILFFIGKWYIRKVKREHDSNEAMSEEVERKERE